MRLGFSLGTLLGHEDVLRCAILAEKRGVESIWIPESWARESFVTLGNIAALTKQILLGTGIISIYSRTPATIAMAIATLDTISKGRAFLGLGASSKVLVENWHGEKFSHHLSRMREYVEIIQSIIKGNTVNYEGKVNTIRNFKLGFKPERNHIPVYIAATNGRMMKLSTVIADGVVLFLRPVSELRKAVSSLQKLTHNRNFDIICVIITAIAKEREFARDRARKTLAFYAAVGNIYGEFLSSIGFKNEILEITECYKKEGLGNIHKLIPDKMLDAITIAGEPEESRKKIGKFMDTGITFPVIQFNPVEEPETSFKEVLDTFLG